MRGPAFGCCMTSKASAGGASCANNVGEKTRAESIDESARQYLRQRFTIFHRERTHRIPAIGLTALVRKFNRWDAGSRIKHGDSHIVVAFGKVVGNEHSAIVDGISGKPFAYVHWNFDAH